MPIDKDAILFIRNKIKVTITPVHKRRPKGICVVRVYHPYATEKLPKHFYFLTATLEEAKEKAAAYCIGTTEFSRRLKGRQDTPKITLHLNVHEVEYLASVVPDTPSTKFLRRKLIGTTKIMKRRTK